MNRGGLNRLIPVPFGKHLHVCLATETKAELNYMLHTTPKCSGLSTTARATDQYRLVNRCLKLQTGCFRPGMFPVTVFIHCKET